MVGIAFALSNDRKNIKWKTVVNGILLQVLLAIIILKTNIGKMFFSYAKDFFQGILNFTSEGSMFLFGDLARAEKLGFVFATMVLPTIIFFGSLMSVLYHLGVMQKIIKFTAHIMMKVMNTSGVESLAAAANIFAGQTEAPLVVKPYISKMTKSELMALMSGGMATMAGGVLAAYVGLGIDAGHLLAASVMSAPAALVCAKILVPETVDSVTNDHIRSLEIEEHVNIIDAAASGAAEGMKLALNVGAMLLAFIALIAMLNGGLSVLEKGINSFYSMFSPANPKLIEGLTLELILGYIFAPIAALMGVPLSESVIVGSLLGKKVVINEFVAYLDLKDQLSSLSPRAVVISTYALCGFSNFSSIAIQLGGIGTIAPSRRKDLANLGIKSLIAGSLACFMTACIAGIFI